MKDNLSRISEDFLKLKFQKTIDFKINNYQELKTEQGLADLCKIHLSNNKN